ncbi:uncharacterized protein DS421_8g253110 [Arachis hypogaea]|nr:uncharacterized protein DS421_8g253110 [Arachis hypogaea]
MENRKKKKRQGRPCHHRSTALGLAIELLPDAVHGATSSRHHRSLSSHPVGRGDACLTRHRRSVQPDPSPLQSPLVGFGDAVVTIEAEERDLRGREDRDPSGRRTQSPFVASVSFLFEPPSDLPLPKLLAPPLPPENVAAATETHCRHCHWSSDRCWSSSEPLQFRSPTYSRFHGEFWSFHIAFKAAAVVVAAVRNCG